MAAPSTAEAEFKFPVKVMYSVTPEMRRALAVDFAFVASITGSGETPLHRQVFGAIAGQDYMAYLTKRVHMIVMRDNKDSAVVGRASSHVLTFYKSANENPTDIPQVMRLETLFHEARHAEGFMAWPHVKCPKPYLDEAGREIFTSAGDPMGGRYACDKSPLGAYGVGALLLSNLAKGCASCSGKFKEDAAFYAKDYAWRVIDPSGRRRLMEDSFK